jgi:glutamine amidotransferase-like uncharacterized protein
LICVSIYGASEPSRAAAPVALVFGGEGTENDDPTGTLHSAVTAARSAGFVPVIVTGKLSDEVLASAAIWIQPGGPNFDQAYDMQRTGVFAQVRDFVARGGGYLGLCGGGFMGQSSGSLGLGLLPGMAYRHGEVTHKTAVTWAGRKRYLHFENGPEFQTGPGIEVVATYDWNGGPAAVRGHFGRGRVFLSGPHPEAGDDWDPTEDPDGLDWDLIGEMLRWAAAGGRR